MFNSETRPKLISYVKESARESDSRPSLTPSKHNSEHKKLAIFQDDLSCPSIESDLDEENLLGDSQSDPFLLPAEEKKATELSQDDSAI